MSESAREDSAGDAARPSGGSGRGPRAEVAGAGSSGGERARTGPAEVGRTGTGRKPDALGLDQQGPPRRGGGGRKDDVVPGGSAGRAGSAARKLQVAGGPGAGRG